VGEWAKRVMEERNLRKGWGIDQIKGEERRLEAGVEKIDSIG
jgi:hypothetical protein